MDYHCINIMKCLKVYSITYDIQANQYLISFIFIHLFSSATKDFCYLKKWTTVTTMTTKVMMTFQGFALKSTPNARIDLDHSAMGPASLKVLLKAELVAFYQHIA